MITRKSILSMLAVAASLTLFTGVASAQVKRIDPSKVKVKVKKYEIKKRVQLKIRDLAAHRIDFTVLRKTSRFAGRVRITGTVKNVGNLPWVSGRNQQVVYLFENSRLVARRSFTNLAVGQEVKVSFDRSWSRSDEFPPTYKLMIGFDPDIYADGNPKNDDMRRANNSKTRSGYDMHKLWDLLERLEKAKERIRKQVKRRLK